MTAQENPDPRLGLPSASNTAFWNCPGQWQIVQSIPKDEIAKVNGGDQFTEMGNRVDKARETMNPLSLSEEETELYNNGLKFERLLVDKWKEDFAIDKYEEGPRKERLYLHDSETLDPIVSGESDCHYVSLPDSRYVLINDWKLIGPNVSRAERNTQMRVLAVLKWRDRDGIEVIRVAINRCMAKIGADDYCDYQRRDLEHSEYWMLHHLWLSKQQDAPTRAGSWCRNCPAKAYCETAAAHSMLPSVIASRSLKIDSKGAATLAVSTLTPQDLVRCWEVGKVAAWIESAVTARLKSMSTEELSALGMMITEGRRLDPIIDVRGAWERLKAGGFSEDDLWICLSMSKTPVVELVQREMNLTKERAQDWVRKNLSDCIEKKQAEGSLAKIK